MSATFHSVEVELLHSLVDQLLELVRDTPPAAEGGDDAWASALGLGNDTPSRPTDPVVLRLFPDAYRGDDEAASDFRRYTERGLREAKAGFAATVLASLATAGSADPDEKPREKVKVDLDADQAQAWLRTLTDLRLALGTRLAVVEGDETAWDSLDDDDPRRHVHDVYDWIGWVQETLVRALSAGLA